MFENLRMLPHAPGVQMQAIPEDAIQEDSGDEEEDDPNKRISSKNLLYNLHNNYREGYIHTVCHLGVNPNTIVYLVFIQPCPL